MAIVTRIKQGIIRLLSQLDTQNNYKDAQILDDQGN